MRLQLLEVMRQAVEDSWRAERLLTEPGFRRQLRDDPAIALRAFGLSRAVVAARPRLTVMRGGSRVTRASRVVA